MVPADRSLGGSGRQEAPICNLSQADGTKAHAKDDQRHGAKLPGPARHCRRGRNRVDLARAKRDPDVRRRLPT